MGVIDYLPINKKPVLRFANGFTAINDVISPNTKINAYTLNRKTATGGDKMFIAYPDQNSNGFLDLESVPVT